MALENNLLGLVPVTTLESTLELVVVESIDVGKDAILILQVTEGGADWWDSSLSGERANSSLGNDLASLTRAGQEGCVVVVKKGEGTERVIITKGK